ncbi:hypothetical protein H0H92_001071 [Tricholoma furcatifolium]|nr:hypothetical protein H0H92_001071 [Tricholoma furcatifolium]
MDQPSASAPTEQQVKDLYDTLEADLAASEELANKLPRNATIDEKEKLRESYRPFFKAMCRLYDRYDDVPLPSGYELLIMHTRSNFFSMTEYLEKHPVDHNRASLMQRALSVEPEAKEAWKTSYIGDAHLLLRDYIDDIAKKRKVFKEPLTPANDPGYANFCAIIQGSGTGKSRLVDQLAEYVFTIPFVLRKVTDKSGYPLLDVIQKESGAKSAVVEAFSVQGQTAAWLQQKDLLLLLRCLNYVKTWITESQQENLTLEDLIQRWHSNLADPQNRQKLHDHATAGTRLGDAADLDELFFGVKDKPSVTETNLNKQVIKYAEKVVKLLQDRSTGGENPQTRTYILFSFDEAHNLTTEERTSEKAGNDSRTAYQCLCKALNYFTGSPVFALFLSTYSRLSDFSPSHRHFWSSRGTPGTGEILNAPFVELPFDEYRDAETSSKLVTEGKSTIQEVCGLEYMARFGRPLFWAHMAHSTSNVVMSIAMQKLVLKREDNLPLPYKVDNSELLPLIAIRVDLTFESNRDEAVYLESLMVASSMRTVYSVPDHRQYLRGGYPSEPFLAEAAARNLFLQMRQQATSWDSLREAYHANVPDAVSKWLHSGLIQKGERGELVARMLVTLAHDIAIINLNDVDDYPLPDAPFPFSVPISVVNFLSSLIAKEYLDIVLDARPENRGGCTLREAFQNAYVHFTHFVRGEDDYILTDQACMIFMCRGAAVQGYGVLPTVDLVIPVVMDNTKPLHRDNMSAIFIQVKNRVNKKKDAEMNVDSEGKLSDFFSSKDDQRPYIAMTMELDSSETLPKKESYAASVEQLGRHIQVSPNEPISAAENTYKSEQPFGDTVQVNSSDRSQETSRSTLHPRYRVIINGCSSSVYNTISSTDRARYLMLLAYTGLLSEHPRQDEKYLKALLRMKPSFRRGVNYDFVEMKPNSWFEQKHTDEEKKKGTEPAQKGQVPRKKKGKAKAH